MKKKLINIAKSYDFSTETEFYDYLIDSHINGNFDQCRKLFAEMKKEGQKDFLRTFYDDNLDTFQFYFNLL